MQNNQLIGFLSIPSRDAHHDKGQKTVLYMCMCVNHFLTAVSEGEVDVGFNLHFPFHSLRQQAYFFNYSTRTKLL